MSASIEILYLRYPVHPNITVIQLGPGIARIDKEGGSYWVVGTEDGPLAGKKVEIPGDNVAAILMQILQGDRTPPSTLDPEIPHALDAGAYPVRLAAEAAVGRSSLDWTILHIHVGNAYG